MTRHSHLARSAELAGFQVDPLDSMGRRHHALIVTPKTASTVYSSIFLVLSATL
jgi:hypothetical protein